MSRDDSPSLLDQFGRIDSQLFDLLLRGRLTPQMKILDAGCGAGENSYYLVRVGAEISGVDKNPLAIELAKERWKRLGAGAAADRYSVADGARLPFPDSHFDAVLSIRVLHFASDKGHFSKMVAELVRVLRPGGVLVVRTSVRGAAHVSPIQWASGRARYLTEISELAELASELQLTPCEPLTIHSRVGGLALASWVCRRVE